MRPRVAALSPLSPLLESANSAAAAAQPASRELLDFPAAARWPGAEACPVIAAGLSTP